MVRTPCMRAGARRRRRSSRTGLMAPGRAPRLPRLCAVRRRVRAAAPRPWARLRSARALWRRFTLDPWVQRRCGFATEGGVGYTSCMQLPLLLDRAAVETLTDQLAGQLRQAIATTQLPSGLRLPSSRRLAEQLEVARNTVIRAYEALIVEGLIESRPSSGLFVALTAAERNPAFRAIPRRISHAKPLVDAAASGSLPARQLTRSRDADVSRMISRRAAPTQRSFRSRLGVGCS